MSNIMLDLETLGTRPGSVIVSLGAVKFGPDGVTDEYYTRICPQSCVDLGLHMDPKTIRWWMAQSDKARRTTFGEDATHLCLALGGFTSWAREITTMWGNGATFDNVLLSEAYAACGLSRAWSHKADRCYRTVKALHPGVPYERIGVEHNALDDARDQAMHLIKILGGNIR